MLVIELDSHWALPAKIPRTLATPHPSISNVISNADLVEIGRQVRTIKCARSKRGDFPLFLFRHLLAL